MKMKENVIICGDCLDIMRDIPDNSVDLVLTDPPYGIGIAKGTKGKARAHKFNYGNECDSPEYIKAKCVPAIIECIRISKAVILTPGSKCMTFYPPPDAFGCILQPATCGMQKWGRADSQPIFYYGKDPRAGKDIRFCSFKTTEKPSCPQHPCSKPQKLWEILVDKGSLEDTLILDPFCGSGTTCVAAKRLGRRYIGIDISLEYCDIARKRLEAEEKGITVKELDKGQGSLFSER